MTRLMRWLIPDKALTWAHTCIAWRFDNRDCCYHYMYAGGFDRGFIEVDA